MKINAIRIKNLASLEGTTEIDFTSEPLASAGIFAITGPTGAGKSTLLDALCLALYGKTPRYLQAREMGIEIHDVVGSTMSQGDVRGILRDGTSEGFAEVDFIGIDGHNYRSTWSVRRARNKADGSLQADTIALKNISTQLEWPGKKVEIFKEIERLVGLNFEQFTRSVLLAQGDFTAFMKANKDEKSALLEKLTGTHIYSEISKKIFEKYKNEERLLRELTIRQEGISTLSEEELTAIQTEELLLTTQLNQLSLEIEALSKEIMWHEQFIQLSQRIDDAKVTLQKANAALIESEVRKIKLIQVEQAQSARTWNDALLYNRQELVVHTANVAVLKAKISELHLQKELFNQQFLKEELQLVNVSQIQKEALPMLAAAKKLDTIISEKNKQKLAAKTEAEFAKTKQESQQKQISEKEAEIAQFSAKIKTIQEWQTKFEMKRAIAENSDVLVSKLSDAEKLVATLKTSSAEKKELDAKMAVASQDIQTETVTFEKLEREWQIQQKAYQQKATAVLLIPIERLHLEKEESDRLVNATLEAQSMWNVLYAMHFDLDTLHQKQTTDQAASSNKNEKLHLVKTQLERDFIAKETAEKIVQKARLSATATVETLRTELVNHEPCPVCGSESHPYVLHNLQLEKVLTTLEASHKQNEKAYLTTFGENSRLEQECKNLSELLQRQENEIATKKRLAESKNKEWTSNAISNDCKHIAANQKTDWFDENIRSLKNKQANLQVQIKAYTTQKNQLDSEKSQLDNLKEKKDECDNKGREGKSQLAIYIEKREGLTKELSQTTMALAEIKNSLSVYFNASDWMDKWIEKPNDFVTSIRNFAQEWKTNSELLEYHKKQQLVVIATITQLYSQAKNLKEECTQKVTTHNEMEDEFAKLKVDRNAIYNGQSAEFMEKQFATAVDKAQKKLDDIKNMVSQNKVDYASAEAQNKEIGLSISKLTIEIENTNSKMQRWISDYNQKFQQSLTIVELNELLTFTLNWIENERKVLTNLEDERTKVSSVLSERTQKFEEHTTNRPSERPLEELKIQHENTKTHYGNFTQAKAAIGFKVKEDKANKLKIGGLLDQISAQAKITDNWSKLNEIIGSADGKKFRQIAQEYTLEALLSYANIHLQALTSRYKIERIPTTLGLQVVDLDMGDEIRTVYSLSGGESFLVSLALALGLASLSSSKMKVESLFIDEGFGSLDPNTLNIAMDALERLHNQGRKVGVISHVQEMTERIPVQIKVSKKSSGRSMVELVGM